MSRVLERPQAAIDLIDIWSFISQDSLATADRFLDWLESKFELLAAQPYMGQARGHASFMQERRKVCSPLRSRRVLCGR